jgi:hypothetical protein
MRRTTIEFMLFSAITVKSISHQKLSIVRFCGLVPASSLSCADCLKSEKPIKDSGKMIRVTCSTAPASFPDLLEQAASGECGLSRLLEDPNILEVYQKQNDDLTRQLSANVHEFLSIALGVIPSDHKDLCRRMLFRIPLTFAGRISLSPATVATLSNFMAVVDASRTDDVNLFCYLLQHFSKISGGRFLLLLPDAELFCRRLFDIAFVSPAVFDLVMYILSDGHPDFAAFLNKVEMSRLIWERYAADQRNDYLLFLSQVLNCVDASSVCIQYASDPEKVEWFFRTAITTEDRETRDLAMSVLYEMCSHCDDEDESETSMMVRVFQYMIRRVDQLAAFLGNDTSFSLGKSRAIEIIQAIVAAEESVAPSIIRAAGKLFAQMVAAPNFSILHCATVTLFELVMEADPGDIEPIVAEYRIRETIAEKFKQGGVSRPFDAHLCRIAQMLAKLDSDNGAWQQLLAGPVKEMDKLMSSPYGGSHPNKALGAPIRDD